MPGEIDKKSIAFDEIDPKINDFRSFFQRAIEARDGTVDESERSR